MRHALPHENKRGDDGQRQQHVERAAGEIDPEIADGLAGGPREGADQRHGKRDAGGSRHEILGGEPHHLRQIAERAFAAVVLPVGVAGEADRGVEGKVGRDGRHACRIERQQSLEPHERVDAEEARGVEQQHGDRIGDPMLLARLVDASNPVKPALDRAEHRRQERALALEHLRHIAAERHDERGEDHEINGDLNPTIEGHDAPLRISRA